MKIFMPAAKQPILLLPCSQCCILHITISDEVHCGNTIFCTASGNAVPLYDYYADLLCCILGDLTTTGVAIHSGIHAFI